VVAGDTRVAIGYTSGMGTWDSGPFDNDAVADLLAETDPSPASFAARLRVCADADADAYLDVDDGQPAIAIAEIVALGFGYGDLDAAPGRVRALARMLGPDEDLRLLAIRALRRIREPGHSEIASLWAHDPAFDARIAALVDRLVDAGS